MRFSLHSICVLLLLAVLGSCSQKVSTLKEYHSWITEEDNGCKLTKTINGLNITIQYLPHTYMALKEMERRKLSNKPSFDSLANYYNTQLHFLLTIESADEQRVLFKGITNPEEYAQRVNELNFNIENTTSVKTMGNLYKPVLTSLENTYNLGKDVKLNLLFAPHNKVDELANAEDIEFSYDDETFAIGSIHAVFNKKNINEHLPVYTGLTN